MPDKFMNLRYHVADPVEEGVAGPILRAGLQATGFKLDFSNDESAARSYLGRQLGQDKRLAVRGLSAPSQPEVVPAMRMVSVQEVPKTNTRLVKFEQTQSKIPIFGSLAVVELSADGKRDLVSIDAELAEVGQLSPLANVSPLDAVKSVAEFTGVDPKTIEQVDAPHLTYFFEEEAGIWHLAYFLRNMPAAPKELRDEAASSNWRGHGLGKSPRTLHPLIDYLVDAHSGKVIFYYPAAPMIQTNGEGQMPTRCIGKDENDVNRDFFGRVIGAEFELFDPLRSVATYDLLGSDIARAKLPTRPVTSAAKDFKNSAAVAAHVYATAVNRFYKEVLSRDGIDDKGMTLVSVVNTTYAENEAPPEWHNAVWHNNCMWYGQAKVNGVIRSYARFLDVIAHELTHGVTQYTSNLVYQGQSGALNESFSDIFGVLIKNWFLKKWDSPRDWDWEIGSGLGSGGLPLRDLSNPARTSDPDHMSKFVKTFEDSGGVHTNSNIHNKAAYNLITAKDEKGDYLFSPEDSTVLFYLCLMRLSSQANFSKVPEVLLDTAKTFYAGDAVELKHKTKAIEQAYQDVGIG
jgi:Zn-dependent metalloprotease